MAGKYMKIRRIVIPTITMVIIASQLFGCACSTQKELNNMINNSQQIEIEVPEPNFEEQGTESELTWIQLSELKNYSEFRDGFDKVFDIETSDYSKAGILYIDSNGKSNGNNTLLNVFSNKSFVENYWNNESKQDAISTLAIQLYVDVDEESVDALYAAINAYFNLLADNEVNFYNGQATLSRAEAMTMLMRSVTPVETLKTNEAFTNAVGDSDFTDYASYVADDSYLTIADKSLNNQTFNGTITRGEFIYMVVNNIFGSDIVSNTDITNISLRDCKATTTIHEYKETSYVKSYDLNFAIQNPDDGAPEDLYKALAVANKLGVIGSETRWDEALVKSEAVEIIVDAVLAHNNLNGYKVEVETGEIAETDYTARAVAKYKELEGQLSIPESTYVNEYLILIENGSTPEEAEAHLYGLYEIVEETPTEPSTESSSDKPSEQPTEKPTQAPTIDPFMIDPEGSYTDSKVKVNGMFTYYLRTFENGAKRNVVHAYYVGVIDKYYYVKEAGVLPQNVSNDVAAIFDAYYENQNPTQPAEKPTQKPVETPTEKPSTGNNEEGTTEYDPWASWGEDPGDWYEDLKDIEGDIKH